MKHFERHNVSTTAQLKPVPFEITSVRQFVMLFVITAILALSGVGCNTAHGFGKDVEKAGEKIQEGTK